MTTSLLEQTRQLHEDIEVAEKVASRLLSEKAKRKPKFRPIYDHAVYSTIAKIQTASRRLLELYADKDDLRAEEIGILGGSKRYGAEDEATDATGADDDKVVWLNFYDQLKALKDYHRQHNAAGDVLKDTLTTKEILRDVTSLAAETLERVGSENLFSPEESLGRRIDLSTLLLEYSNLTKLRKHRETVFRQNEIARLKKKLKDVTGEELQNKLQAGMADIQFHEIDYISYLKNFDEFSAIPRYCKFREPQYKRYLEKLLGYLQDFLRRLNPLSDHQRMTSHLKGEFEEAWNKKLVRSWETPTHQLPTFCAPTEQLFASEGTLKGYKQGKRYQKSLLSFQSVSIEDQKRRIVLTEEEDKALALTEFLIQKYRDILSTVIQRTIEHVQKKQSRTLRELQMELEDSDDENEGALVLIKEELKAAPSEEEDESDNEKPIYNPLNLPLGWDGKPIPYWLYKLHGLGVEYKCEICGNYSYWGRRAFERHFQEWRHAFGMKCLKIPNTVHFKEITKIEDAVMLYEKLKREVEVQSFKADQDVECEDSEGNVMSARAYEDLRRQGLL